MRVRGTLRPATVRSPASLKLRTARFRQRAEARGFLGVVETLVEACSAEGFRDLVGAYITGKPVYVNQVERFAGPASILDAIGGLSSFKGASADLQLYLRQEAEGSNAYLRLSLGGSLTRPTLHVAVEWRNPRWWPEAPDGAQRAYDAIADLAKAGTLTRFSTGCTAQLEALAARLSDVLVDGEPPKGEIDDAVQVPAGRDLGRLRLVDFETRANRQTRIAKLDPPPSRLLEAFHDDPYFDFVAWALHRLACEGLWAPPEGRQFVRSDRPDKALSFTGPEELGIERDDVRLVGKQLLISENVATAGRVPGGLRAYSIAGWGGDNG